VKRRLEELGTLRGGYPPRGPVSSIGGPGYVQALQGRDVRDGEVQWGGVGWIETGPATGKYAVTDGDVVLPLRGESARALVLQQPPPDAVVVGHWMLISPARDRIGPEYLAWYLNHPATSARLSGLMRGTKLLFFSLADLRGLEIDVPPLEVQRQIVRASALNDRVSELERQIALSRQQLVDAVTFQALTGRLTPSDPI
jgi:hypothetical protein